MPPALNTHEFPRRRGHGSDPSDPHAVTPGVTRGVTHPLSRALTCGNSTLPRVGRA